MSEKRSMLDLTIIEHKGKNKNYAELEKNEGKPQAEWNKEYIPTKKYVSEYERLMFQPKSNIYITMDNGLFYCNSSIIDKYIQDAIDNKVHIYLDKLPPHIERRINELQSSIYQTEIADEDDEW